MEILRLSDVTIPEFRQRQRFNEESLKELGASIWSKGLLHPIVVRNDGRTLVAGGRRLRAVELMNSSYLCDGSLVPLGHIPVTRIGQLDPILIEETELEENLIREDLTLAERASAIRRLHDLRKTQDPGQTPTDTAREILREGYTGARAQEIRDSLIIAAHLDDPVVATAADTRSALREVRKKLARTQRVAAALRTGEVDSRHRLIAGDAMSELPLLPDGTFHCIITDPPFGVSAESFGGQAGARHTYSDDPTTAAAAYSLVAEQGYRLTTANAHLYCFCDIRQFERLADLFSSEGWTVWSTPLIWNKGGGMLPAPEYGPRRSYESILFARKGTRKVQYVASDVISIPSLQAPRRGAEKPWQLYSELLKRSCLPGESVLDPFAGCGPVFTAANRLQLIATGCELDSEALGMCLEAMALKPKVDILDLE